MIAQSVDSEGLRALGLLLDNAIVYGLLVLGLLMLGEGRDKKRMKILLAIALSAVLGICLKFALAHERPCAGQEWCPWDYSFPSLHAAIAFTLMIGFVNKRSYPAYLLFALFVSFTRLNLGVHNFMDIAGALPLGLLSYYAVHLALGGSGNDR